MSSRSERRSRADPVARAAWLRRPVGEPAGVDRRRRSADGVPSGTKRLAQLLGHPRRARLDDCQADFEYRVIAGPVESPTYRVKVIHPLDAHVPWRRRSSPPPTPASPLRPRRTGDFQVIEGSKVRFRFTLDRPPAEARLVVTPKAVVTGGAGTPLTVPLAIEGPVLTGELARRSIGRSSIGSGPGPTTAWNWNPGRTRSGSGSTRSRRSGSCKPAEDLAVIPTTEVPMRGRGGRRFRPGRGRHRLPGRQRVRRRRSCSTSSRASP